MVNKYNKATTPAKNLHNITFYPKFHPMENLQQAHPASNKRSYRISMYFLSKFMEAMTNSTNCVNQIP